jgi:uncharacterized protein involved in exopolysaccharide biosynthesis
MGQLKPVFPKKGITLLMALLLGIALPAIYFYLKLNVKSILKEE